MSFCSKLFAIIIPRLKPENKDGRIIRGCFSRGHSQPTFGEEGLILLSQDEVHSVEEPSTEDTIAQVAKNSSDGNSTG